VLVRLDGSSPHTRGTLKLSYFIPGLRRFIPAYAGNTHILGLPAPEKTVHPRIRGEHVVPADAAGVRVGSSPHTRGTLLRLPGYRGAQRFIPAYAGNTGQRSCRTTGPPVHPRIRGEHAVEVGSESATAGSSPHTRGTRVLVVVDIPIPRFIPAYAGNTRR